MQAPRSKHHARHRLRILGPHSPTSGNPNCLCLATADGHTCLKPTMGVAVHSFLYVMADVSMSSRLLRGKLRTLTTSTQNPWGPSPGLSIWGFRTWAGLEAYRGINPELEIVKPSFRRFGLRALTMFHVKRSGTPKTPKNLPLEPP